MTKFDLKCSVEQKDGDNFYCVTVDAQIISYGVDAIIVSKLASMHLQDIIQQDLVKEQEAEQ